MGSNYKKLGPYIQVVNERNSNLNGNILLGVSIRKCFMPSIANTIGTDMSTYKLIKKNQFAYGPVTSRNGDKISVALLDEYENGLVSQAYVVFEIIDTNELDPEYLMMWFRRPEFDRYARFKSHGSAREIFDWSEMCDTELPIPSIEKQREIVNEYNVIQKRITLNNQLIQKLEDTAQTIYKQWFVEFEFPNEDGKPYKSNSGKMVWCEELEKEIPEGWDVKNLSDFIEVKYGKDYKKLSDGKYPMYGSGGIMKFVNDFLYDKASVLIPRKGSLNNILFIDEPFWSVDTMFYSKLKRESYGFYIFRFLKGLDFNALNVGSAVPSMTTEMLNGMKLISPKYSLLEDFNKLLYVINFNSKVKIQGINKLQNLEELILSKITKVIENKE
jgi:type I restriction enzyme S subunit